MATSKEAVALGETIPMVEETTSRDTDIEAVEPVLQEESRNTGSIEEAFLPPIDLMTSAGSHSRGQLHGVLQERLSKGADEKSDPVDFLGEHKESDEATEGTLMGVIDLSGLGQKVQESTQVDGLAKILDESNTNSKAANSLGADAAAKPLQIELSDVSEIRLLGLPSDALHSITSFLSPGDCCNFGVCSSGASKVLREVLRKVRMHGFRCATEVVTAWVSSYDQLFL
jgi:hypothetical protein